MIKTITYADLEPYIAETEKLGLSFCNATEYYGYYDDGKLAAFTGILWYSKKAVFKNHYVLPDYRHRGFFKLLFRYSMIAVRERGIKVVEANCSQMSLPLYIKMGAKITKQFKDWTQVQLKL
jgi:GNAT superfamily N-acetyltransferase